MRNVVCKRYVCGFECVVCVRACVLYACEWVYRVSFLLIEGLPLRTLDGLNSSILEQGPMDNDEFVIRFFGMKDCDGMLKVATNLTTGKTIHHFND